MLDFDLADNETMDQLSGGKLEAWRGKKGETDRIAIVYFKPKAEWNEDENGDAPLEMWDTDGPCRFKGQDIFFKKGTGLGYTIYKGKDPAIIKALGGEPKGRIGTLVVKYRTDEEGNPMKPINPSTGWKVMPWYFSRKMVDQLKRVNRENPLHTSDLVVTCNNQDYQHLEFIGSSQCLWRHNEELKAAILAAAHKLAPRIPEGIGRERDEDELREKLGMQTNIGTDTETNYDDLLG